MGYMLGVHCSVSGGLENAFDEAKTLDTDVMQIFTRNQRQWSAKPIGPDEASTFLKKKRTSNIKVAFSHCSYLINLAAESDDTRNKSIEALCLEVDRCTTLGLDYCVLHPGAAGTQSFDLAIKKIADGLKHVLNHSNGSGVMILLENTAGQGTSVGGPFENLRQIRDLTESNRIGYCFDTCHAYAAGHDISTEEGCMKTFDSFDNILGLENLKAFHLNDSKGDLGSKLDRHEHIGKGKLGVTPFKYIMNRFKEIPKVIETEKEGDWDVVNLELLRSLV
ncbi:MAG: deoxyribonuclease IV [Bacteroidota bacterium]